MFNWWFQQIFLTSPSPPSFLSSLPLCLPPPLYYALNAFTPLYLPIPVSLAGFTTVRSCSHRVSWRKHATSMRERLTMPKQQWKGERRDVREAREDSGEKHKRGQTLREDERLTYLTIIHITMIIIALFFVAKTKQKPDSLWNYEWWGSGSNKRGRWERKAFWTRRRARLRKRQTGYKWFLQMVQEHASRVSPQAHPFLHFSAPRSWRRAEEEELVLIDGACGARTSLIDVERKERIKMKPYWPRMLRKCTAENWRALICPANLGQIRTLKGRGSHSFTDVIF